MAGAIPRGGARHGRYGRQRRRRQRFTGSIGTHIHPILTHTVAVKLHREWRARGHDACRRLSRRWPSIHPARSRLELHCIPGDQSPGCTEAHTGARAHTHTLSRTYMRTQHHTLALETEGRRQHSPTHFLTYNRQAHASTQGCKKKSEQHTGGYSGKRPRTAPGEGLPNAREACEPFLVASGANRRRRHSESMPGAGFLSTRHWAEAAAAHPSAGGRGCTVCE